MAYDLAIVLPTFNESGNVGPIVDRLEKALNGIRYEVIFVDDDSPDGTADVVRRLAERHATDRPARAGVGMHRGHSGRRSAFCSGDGCGHAAR
jgi:glycosyltransferase involved in cell wall biosynthesis